jgi:hypothetical protein
MENMISGSRRIVSILLAAVLLYSAAFTVDLPADPGSGESEEQVRQKHATPSSGSTAAETKRDDENPRLLARAGALKIPDQSYKADRPSPSDAKNAEKTSQLRRIALVILLSLFERPPKKNP